MHTIHLQESTPILDKEICVRHPCFLYQAHFFGLFRIVYFLKVKLVIYDRWEIRDAFKMVVQMFDAVFSLLNSVKS